MEPCDARPLNNTHSAEERTIDLPLRNSDATASSATSPGVFVHERLDHNAPSIRLVELLPTLSPSGLIQCTVWHTTTRDASQDDRADVYDAVSYMWGLARVVRPILLNGLPFMVRENLWSFLDSAIHTPTTQRRVLWIDALCIDQSNTRERNHQVHLMGKVYSQARQVLIWLGQGTSATNALWQFISGSNLSCDDFMVVANGQRHIPKYEAAFFELLNHPYWHRTWIIQEILLARDIIVVNGEQNIPWEVFSGFVLSKRYWVDEQSRQIQQSAPRKFCQYRLSRPHQMHSIHLADLLQRFGSWESGDVRDRVFALLPLALNGLEFPINYDRTKVEVFYTALNFMRAPSISTIKTLMDTLKVKPEDLVAMSSPSSEGHHPQTGFSRRICFQYGTVVRELDFDRLPMVSVEVNNCMRHCEYCPSIRRLGAKLYPLKDTRDITFCCFVEKQKRKNIENCLVFRKDSLSPNSEAVDVVRMCLDQQKEILVQEPVELRGVKRVFSAESDRCHIQINLVALLYLLRLRNHPIQREDPRIIVTMDEVPVESYCQEDPRTQDPKTEDSVTGKTPQQEDLSTLETPQHASRNKETKAFRPRSALYDAVIALRPPPNSTKAHRLPLRLKRAIAHAFNRNRHRRHSQPIAMGSTQARLNALTYPPLFITPFPDSVLRRGLDLKRRP